ncbi:EAL domain-containing protein [Rhizobium sp. AQ_MP]|uniref:putative bifunctional diguanylate cyclase/phosphodiesterase n=1 Tax=Rhizobium sp. AQ_MP TaxID=2761536 RepID=UPI00163A8AB2|nr:EAL domain-containing protein [Rhizobium sp. AQ_MP]MBC2774815.1 EAL domain-containing protein [Rhizobium sp. AQ_MP]
MEQTFLARAASQISTMVDRFLRLGEEDQTAEEADRIRAIRLSVLSSSTPWMMAANLCNATLTIFVFQGSPSAPAVYAICGLLLAIIFYTSLSWWRNRKRGQRERASLRGTNRTVVYAAILSALWAAIDIVAYPSANETQRMVLIALTVGMAGGGGFALATIPPASIVFCGMIAFGAAIALLRDGSIVGAYLFALYIVFAAIIIRSSLALCKSLTERVRAKLAADEQRDVIGLLLNDFEENASDWLWGVDSDLNLERASARFYDKLQIPENMVLGRPLMTIMPFSSVSLEGHDCRENFANCLMSRQSFRDQDLCVEVGGELGIWSVTAKAIYDEQERFKGYRGVGRDVTANRESRLRIEHMARHDPLTEVGNRVLLSEDFERAVSRYERFGDAFSVLLLDLDRFKQVNDNFGHTAGDELLRTVASILSQLRGENDTLARVGGDEFAILHACVDDPRSAATLASRIIERFAHPITLGCGSAQIGVSIGIACAPIDGTEPDQLMRNADLALYRAKTDGRNRYRFFDSSLDAAARRRSLLEQELALAIAEESLTVHFQPLVSAETRQVVCAEALLRWNHPKLGAISPSEFIPIAEEAGQITAIGSWVLRQACRHAATWPDNVRVAVNLSSRQFLSPGLLPLIETAITENGLRSQRLEVEVTESLLMETAIGVEQTLESISRLGVRIALDDFGTGFSSLSYLRRYHFDKLKIDQSFISDLETNPDGRAIVDAVIRLAGELRMSVAAEGVETREQLERLRQMGCGEIQGFLTGRPMPVDAFEEYLKQTNGSVQRLSA